MKGLLMLIFSVALSVHIVICNCTMLHWWLEPTVHCTVLQSIRCSSRTKHYQYRILKLSCLSVQDYVFLAVGRVGSTSENITQKVVWVEESVSSTWKLTRLPTVPVCNYADPDPDPCCSWIRIQTKVFMTFYFYPLEKFILPSCKRLSHEMDLAFDDMHGQF
jgi:hypothetical protein